MDEFEERKSLKFVFLGSIIIILTLLLGACMSQHPPKSKSPSKNEKKKTSHTGTMNDWKLPISIANGEFFKSAGWLSENEVLYITNSEQTSNIYLYHLLSGKSELIYKSDSPIVSVKISPSKTYLLVQSSPSSNVGVIRIIDKKGTVLWKQSIASYQLDFEWNPYDESKILVSKFNEDWTYKTLLIDLKKTKMTDISLPQPFFKWVDKKTIAFINWDDHTSAVFAPLMFKNLENEQEKTVFQSVFQFSAYPNILMTIKANEKDKKNSTYSFFNNEIRPIFSFSIPQLTNFSDWVIPSNDFIESKNKFITFMPLESTESDTYTEGFNLVSYNLLNGKKELILKGMENQPLICSPQGEACLYGNSLEKIIDLKGKKIIKLVKE
jgi:hypothetical protein